MIDTRSPESLGSSVQLQASEDRIRITDLMSKQEIMDRVRAFRLNGMATAHIFVFDEEGNKAVEQIYGEELPEITPDLLKLMDLVRSTNQEQFGYDSSGRLMLAAPIWLTCDGHRYLKGCFASNPPKSTNTDIEAFMPVAKFVADTISDRISYAYRSRIAGYEYQALEHELRLDSELAEMMEKIGAKLMVVDKNLRVLWHNSIITKRCNGVSPCGKICWQAFGSDHTCDPCPALVVFQTGKPQLNVYGRRADGTIANRTSAMPILDKEGKIQHVLVLINDVNDAAEANQAAAELAGYKHLVNCSDDLMLMCDHTGVVLAVNRKMIESLGYNENELIGRHGNVAIVADDVQKFHECARSAKQLGIAMDTIRLHARNNAVLTTQMMLAYDKERNLFEIIFRDISERLRMEKELRERSEELQKQNVKVLAMAEERDRFFRNVSHELRTPLTSVIGFAELLLEDTDEPLSERQKQQLKRVVGNSHKLLSMVNDILDISRIDAGRMEVQIGCLKLQSLIPQIAANLAPQATEKNLALNLHIDENLPPVQSDENKLGQILVNLISNAIKFTNEGKIDVEASLHDKFFRIVVKDTGIGIPEKDLENVFKEFHRAHSEASSVRGSGLGLTIAQGMAGLLGGKIMVKSEEGKGSEFTLELPLMGDARC